MSLDPALAAPTKYKWRQFGLDNFVTIPNLKNESNRDIHIGQNGRAMKQRIKKHE